MRGEGKKEGGTGKRVMEEKIVTPFELNSESSLH